MKGKAQGKKTRTDCLANRTFIGLLASGTVADRGNRNFHLVGFIGDAPVGVFLFTGFFKAGQNLVAQG